MAWVDATYIFISTRSHWNVGEDIVLHYNRIQYLIAGLNISDRLNFILSKQAFEQSETQVFFKTAAKHFWCKQ